MCPDGGRCEVEGTLINTERQRVSLAPGALGSLQMRDKAGRSSETKEGKRLCFLAWCVGSLPVQLSGFCCGWSSHPGRQTEVPRFSRGYSSRPSPAAGSDFAFPSQFTLPGHLHGVSLEGLFLERHTSSLMQRPGTELG